MSVFQRVAVGPRVHAGALFDVHLLEGDGARYAFKVCSAEGDRGDTEVLFGASTVLGGVSTVWDICTCLGDTLDAASRDGWSEYCHDSGSASLRVTGELERALLDSEHARVLQAGAAWNHRTLGIEEHVVPGRGSCVGLISTWIDGVPLSELPRPELRTTVLGMLPALWDALSAAAHGDVHASNLIVMRGRDRFALIDPAAMVHGERGEHMASSGAAWLTFSTHGAAYPVLPPYAASSVTPGVSLRHHVEAFVSSLTAEYCYPSILVGTQTQARAVGRRRMLAPPGPQGAPLAADWHAVGVLYFEALTARHPYAGRLAKPAWASVRVIDDDVRDTSAMLAILEPAPRPPSAFNAAITPAEDELALALLDLRVDTRAALFELTRRAAAAIAAH